MSAEDYWYYQGGALNLSTNFFSKRNQGFYSGLFFSLSAYGYTNKWVTPGAGYDKANLYADGYAFPQQEYRDRFMTSWSGGPAIGRCWRTQYCDVNFFLKAGVEVAKGTIHVKQLSDPGFATYANQAQAPYSYNADEVTPIAMIGTSLAFGANPKPAYMFRYYKEYFNNEMGPLLRDARYNRWHGLLTGRERREIERTAHRTYVNLAHLYMRSIFDPALMEQELEKGVLEVTQMLDAYSLKK